MFPLKLALNAHVINNNNQTMSRKRAWRKTREECSMPCNKTVIDWNGMMCEHVSRYCARHTVHRKYSRWETLNAWVCELHKLVLLLKNGNVRASATFSFFFLSFFGVWIENTILAVEPYAPCTIVSAQLFYENPVELIGHLSIGSLVCRTKKFIVFDRNKEKRQHVPRMISPFPRLT